jgi:hypothetical protein
MLFNRKKQFIRIKYSNTKTVFEYYYFLKKNWVFDYFEYLKFEYPGYKLGSMCTTQIKKRVIKVEIKRQMDRISRYTEKEYL